MGKKFFCMTLFVLPMVSASPVLLAQSGIYFDVGVHFKYAYRHKHQKESEAALF